MDFSWLESRSIKLSLPILEDASSPSFKLKDFLCCSNNDLEKIKRMPPQSRGFPASR